MQGQIDIKISKSQTVQGQAPDVQQDREPGRASTTNQAVNAVLISAGKQVLTQGIQQYGDLTGDYALAETVNDVMTIGADALIIASAGAIGAVAVGTKYAIQAINSSIKQKLAIESIALARERSGYISTQGSRYGR